MGLYGNPFYDVQMMENPGSSRHDIDFEHFIERARLLRNEAIRDLFVAAAGSFVDALRRIRLWAVESQEDSRRKHHS
jgi:hypothetical protein